MDFPSRGFSPSFHNDYQGARKEGTHPQKNNVEKRRGEKLSSMLVIGVKCLCLSGSCLIPNYVVVSRIMNVPHEKSNLQFSHNNSEYLG